MVPGDEEDVEHCGGGQVAGQQAGGVGQQAGSGLQHCQAQEGKGPHAVENLGGSRVNSLGLQHLKEV